MSSAAAVADTYDSPRAQVGSLSSPPPYASAVLRPTKEVKNDPNSHGVAGILFRVGPLVKARAF